MNDTATAVGGPDPAAVVAAPEPAAVVPDPAVAVVVPDLATAVAKPDSATAVAKPDAVATKPDPATAIGTEVRIAAGAAKALLAYANEIGIALDEATTRTIVETEHALTAGALSVDGEVKFWAAYQAVAKAVAPTTLASLRAVGEPPDSLKPGGTRWWHPATSLARRTVRFYTAVVMSVLLVLLVVQVYQLFGTAVTAEIRTLAKEQDEIAAKRSNLSAAALATPENTQLQASLENIALRKTASYALLSWWNERLPTWLAPVATLAPEDADSAMANRIAIQQRALMVIDVMQRYLLPLLYGLLGSCVYVLRTIAFQIRNRTYTESANIDFRLRIYIGALSGLIVGWFFSPDQGGVLATLSPSALAFLAGYSVDLLFSALDRILTAFSSAGGSDSKPAAAGGGAKPQ